jgi:hypothetical protein
MPPPGALVEKAPRRASRAREGDTFFILVTPTEETRAPAAFYEELARRAADVYFASGGGVTGGLRESLTAINRQLRNPPDGKRVNVLALAQRGEELFAARCGRMFGLLVQDSDLVFLPTDRRDPLAMSVPALGADDYPDVQLARYTVAPGQTMLIADAGLFDADDDKLRAALEGDSVRPALDRLKELASSQASMMVIRFAAPGTPDAEHLAPQPSAREPLAVFPRSSKPPVVRESEPAETAPAPTESETTGNEAEEVPPAEHVRDLVSGIAGHVSRPRGPSILTKAALTMRRTMRDVLRAILGGLLAVTNGLLNVLDQILPRPDQSGRSGIPTTVAVSMAILIPVVIVIVVVGLSLSRQGRTDFEVYLDHAQKAHDEALALSGGNCKDKSLRAQWREVLDLAEQAAKFRPDDINVIQIRADAQNYLDCYDEIQRRNLTLLHEFSEGAQLVGPVVHGGVDLYTLDRASSQVYHDTLNERGDALTARDNEPIIQRNQAIGGYVVGEMFDIDWLRSGGTVHDNVLLALDLSGVLISYSPTFFSTAQLLVTDGRWINPVAIAVFRENLYVLDAGANQIWRYVPPTGERRYSAAPEEYFTGQLRPDLREAVDFGISELGEVYILFRDGSIQKFLSAEPQMFEYSQGTVEGGTSLFVDNDPASRALFIVDAANATIYETSWAGTFQGAFRPNDSPNAFRNISGLYADTVARNNLYVVAGNKLYHLHRTE